MTEDEIVQVVRNQPGLLPPATPEAVTEVERAIGYPLPRLLRRLYRESGNGGCGPREGVLGLAGSDYEHDSEWANIFEPNGFEDDPEHRGLLGFSTGDVQSGLLSTVATRKRQCRDGILMKILIAIFHDFSRGI